jgi:hypothetical protein
LIEWGFTDVVFRNDSGDQWAYKLDAAKQTFREYKN